MSNDYKTILFTSNLSTTSRVAFKQAAILANQFDAKLILLHVMEGAPSGSYEGYVSSLFGQDQWQQILKNNKEEAKHALVGKVTPKQMVRTALSEFCKDTTKKDESHVIPNYEIVVKDGDVVETILKQAIESKCDLIVMGAGEGLLSGVSVGKNIKSTLKKSKVPVLVVPGSLG
jgi:nucleotide-binding universal stress UspA family protein